MNKKTVQPALDWNELSSTVCYSVRFPKRTVVRSIDFVNGSMPLLMKKLRRT